MEYFQNEEQDLIKKIEELKAKATEFKKNNEEIKISQQRDLITDNFRKFIEIILNPLIKKNTYFIMDTIDTLNKKSTNNDRLIKLLTYYKTNFKIIFT